jgi:hypothetical protein
MLNVLDHAAQGIAAADGTVGDAWGKNSVQFLSLFSGGVVIPLHNEEESTWKRQKR